MWKSIAIATLLAGTLDITAACLNAYLSANVMPERVLKYVASGVFGKDAYSGGFDMMAWGLFFHFIIAFACTFCYFLVYPKWNFLQKNNILVNSLLIGIVAWVVTTRLIVPISHVNAAPFNLGKAIIAALILVGCIGLPIAYKAQQFFKILNK
jgi:uncharacterized membrane protein YagU involved in acid resistance